MDRRAFLLGLTAAPLVKAAPAVAAPMAPYVETIHEWLGGPITTDTVWLGEDGHWYICSSQEYGPYSWA